MEYLVVIEKADDASYGAYVPDLPGCVTCGDSVEEVKTQIQEAIRLHAEYKVNSVEDLWALELKIREWRRGRRHCFTLNYERANEQLAGWLAKGWLQESDLQRMSPERLHAIHVKT